MTAFQLNAFELTIEQLAELLTSNLPLLPELKEDPQSLKSYRESSIGQMLWHKSETLLTSSHLLPQTTYTLYRQFKLTGDRKGYEDVYYGKRENLDLAFIRLFLGQNVLSTNEKNTLRILIQDYLWNICEETNWVLPAHDLSGPIDLMAAGTAHGLAEILGLAGEEINSEVQNRVRAEIERRVFVPYLEHFSERWWYKSVNNWTSVCNSSIGAAFLWLERNPHRLAQALHVVLDGLNHYLTYAFEDDGTSTEGVNYWHYGLMHFVTFSEMLYARTGGQLNLLASDRIKAIAAYPSKLHLWGPMFAPFADCPESAEFAPCILTRLAERSGETSLLAMATPGEANKTSMGLPMTLRNILWVTPEPTVTVDNRPQSGDALLPSGGIARLTGLTKENQPIILITKAGNNDENHNHNDVGSFVLHIGGENFLTDPGLGLYTRDYFNSRRYESIFTNSYGHSVPRIDGQLQGTGREYSGQVINFDNKRDDLSKAVALEYSRAYPANGLISLQRQFELTSNSPSPDVMWLQDYFKFEVTKNQNPRHQIEEAFMTWLAVEVEGPSALVRGRNNSLRLVIETPEASSFQLERLEEESKANKKEGILKRLTFTLPVKEAVTEVMIRIRMDFVPRGLPGN